MAAKRSSSAKATTPGQSRGITYRVFVKLALKLPAVEESTSYGTPSLKVKGKLLTRLWEDGETLVVRTSFEDRDHLLLAEPKVFFITDHYKGYPAVLVRLAQVKPKQLMELFDDAWRRYAPPRLLAARNPTAE